MFKRVYSFCFILTSIFIFISSPVFAIKTDTIKADFNVSGEYIPEECLLSKENQIFISVKNPVFEKICAATGTTSSLNKQCDEITITKNGINTIFKSKGKNNTSAIQTRQGRDKNFYLNLRTFVDAVDYSYIFSNEKMSCTLFPLLTGITMNNGLLSVTSSGKVNPPSIEEIGNKIIIKFRDQGIKQGISASQNTNLTFEEYLQETSYAVLTLDKNNIKSVSPATQILPNTMSLMINTSETAAQAEKNSLKNNTIKIESKEEKTVKAKSEPTELKNLEISSDEKTLTITITTSSPFDYKWSRFKDPDNRFILEIPACKMALENKETIIEHQLAKSARAAQFEPGPEGSSRIVIDLTSPSSCDITQNSETSISLKFGARIQSPYSLKLSGRGTTDSTAAYIKGDGHIICIDPGHGGGDHGACNKSLGLAEKNITLDISMRLAEILRARGFEVIMTRQTDRDVSYAGSPDSEELGARVEIGKKADLFVSVHINASTNSEASGVSTHWYKDCDKNLAVEIQQSLADKTQRKDRGAVRDKFYVISKTSIPAVLVEAGFISNNEEAKMLTQDEFLQKVALSIADGLGIYVSKYGNGRIATSKRSSASK